MARRRIGQLGWLDGALSQRVSRRRDVLSEINGLVDWGPFARLLDGIHSAAKGEPAYPPLMMFKVLLLQRWYGLSDPAMEEALFDRMSFLGFVGLSAEDETPDHTTIWRFRQKLEKAGLAERLFAELARQLDARGLTVRQGTLIDASLIQSAARRPRMGEGQRSKSDPDATFGTNNERRRFTFGYKLHVGVDQGSLLITDWRLTPAHVQEVRVAPELLPERGAVYADRGYDTKALHAVLAARGLEDGIMRRRRGKRPLTEPEIARNHALSLTRRPVEAIFGTLKRSYGLRRMPYFNLARNNLAMAIAAMAINIRRLHVLATP